MAKHVVVTGGNKGIGLELCKQLVAEKDCCVYLGSRDLARGEAAVSEVLAGCPGAKCQCVVVDTASDESVAAAAERVKNLLDGQPLYALVNNAATGIAHPDLTPEIIIQTNLYGAKRMCEAFLPLLDPAEGRIVNVGSGAGPLFVEKCPAEMKRKLCKEEQTWEGIESNIKECLGSPADESTGMGGYGVSKALLTNYTSFLASQHPGLKINCCTPGYLETDMTTGWPGDKKKPEEGTVSIKHLLFEDLEGNGWYYAEDAVRSPLHFMRSPGEPAYDGQVPDF